MKTSPGKSVFTSRPKEKLTNAEIPGPGAYTVTGINDKPMWSFGGKGSK